MGEKNTSGCGTYLLSWVISSVVLGVFFAMIDQTGQSMGGIIFESVCTGFVVAFAIFAFKMVILTSKVSKEAKKQKKKDKQEGISRYNPIVHVGGLAAPGNCKASAILSPTALTVACGGREYVLSFAKIKNVDFQLDIDETQYLKSSFVKGAVGAAVFGAAGAVVGSAPKVKTKRYVKCYAIISYEDSQGQYRVLLLKDEIANSKVCAKLVDDLRPRINQQVDRVEL